MTFLDEDEEGAYARWILAKASLRARARRQVALGIPIVVASALIVVISTLGFGHATPQSDEHRAPITAPISRHVVVLV